jgi:hypothetical protein
MPLGHSAWGSAFPPSRYQVAQIADYGDPEIDNRIARYEMAFRMPSLLHPRRAE